MYARIVRFSGVTQETIDKIIARIEENDGPPEGVESSGMKLFYDADQGTSVFVGFFDSKEKMNEAHKIMDAMDTGDTPGTRESVDQCELKIEREA